MAPRYSGQEAADRQQHDAVRHHVNAQRGCPHEAPDQKGRTPANYQVTKKLLFEKAKPDAIVLHSLPRQDELSQDVDNTRFQRYWVEAYNGVLVRMSLLALILGAME